MLISGKKKEIQDLREKARNLYASEVENDENPQKYLYQAYRREWKFYKIYQMLEKLALLGITLYTPQGSENWKRLMYATIIACLSFAIVVFTHPLMDPLEAWLDITSRCVCIGVLFIARCSMICFCVLMFVCAFARFANCCNCGIGLMLNLNVKIPTIAVNIIMIGANGVNLGMFVMLVVVGPIRYTVNFIVRSFQ